MAGAGRWDGFLEVGFLTSAASSCLSVTVMGSWLRVLVVVLLTVWLIVDSTCTLSRSESSSSSEASSMKMGQEESSPLIMIPLRLMLLVVGMLVVELKKSEGRHWIEAVATRVGRKMGMGMCGRRFGVNVAEYFGSEGGSVCV